MKAFLRSIGRFVASRFGYIPAPAGLAAGAATLPKRLRNLALRSVAWTLFIVFVFGFIVWFARNVFDYAINHTVRETSAATSVKPSMSGKVTQKVDESLTSPERAGTNANKEPPIQKVDPEKEKGLSNLSKNQTTQVPPKKEELDGVAAPKSEGLQKADCHVVPDGFQQGAFKNLGQCAN